MESGMAIRIGFVVLDGRNHSNKRNLSISSRISGPDVMILSRKRFPKISSFNPFKTQTPVPKMTARTVGRYQVFILNRAL